MCQWLPKESYREKILEAAKVYVEKQHSLFQSSNKVEGIVVLSDIQVISKLGGGRCIILILLTL